MDFWNMNHKHAIVISILAGAAIGFFVPTLHQPTSDTPNAVSRILANLWLSGASAAGATVSSYY